MKQENIFIPTQDGKSLALHTWIPETKIIGVVVLSHGMAEYAMRYDRFGKILAGKGYVFYAHDHRGHGETAGNMDNLGFLADHDGFLKVMNDVKTVIDKAKADFPGVKVFLFGHSFGSFVSQYYIEEYGNEIDGCILCGSAGPRLPLTTVGKGIAGLFKLLKGSHNRSLLIDILAFGTYNKRIPDSNSLFSWISRDPEEVKKYEESPLCGFKCTNSFFFDFFGGLCTIHTKKAMSKIPISLPLFIISGSEDPVGDYGNSLKKLYDIYQKNGVKDIQIKIYDGARHELLNEINREEVENDVLEWFTKHL